MKLTDKLKDSVVVDGITFNIDLPFDKVLKAFELFKDESIPDNLKIDIFIEMFVVNYEDALGLGSDQAVELVKAIYQNLILFEKPKNNSEDDGKYYDLDQDAKYIYASFMKDYGIDLYKEQGKMHWKKFSALLSSLSKETMFARVVGYRTMKVPKPNKHNAEERKRIRELKKIYKLELSEEERKKELEKKFNKLDQAISGK